MAFLESSGAKHGWMTPVLMAIFNLASWPSRALYRAVGRLFSARPAKGTRTVMGPTQFMVQDTFLVLWLLVDLASLWTISHMAGTPRTVAIVYSVWRLVDIISSTARTTLARLPEAIGPSRLIVHGLVNYLEAIVCFASVYSIKLGLISTTITTTDGGWTSRSRSPSTSASSPSSPSATGTISRSVGSDRSPGCKGCSD